MYKLLTCAALAAAIAVPASAQQFRKPEEAIKYRKAAFTVMGVHFGRIGNMVNNRAPYDAKTAAESAQVVATLAQLPFVAFEPGTEKGFETRAKAGIWSENEKFRTAAKQLQDESLKLEAAAKTGNLDALKVSFGAVGRTCKNCHDSYREE